MQRAQSNDESWHAGLRSNPVMLDPVGRCRDRPIHAPKRLHRAFGGRRRYRLTATALPGYVSLEATKHACHLACRRSVRRCGFGCGIEYHQGVSDEIERPLYLSVPATPADMLDGVGQGGSFRAVARRGVRPALGGPSDMLDAHGEMKTIEHVMGRTDARHHRCRLDAVGAYGTVFVAGGPSTSSRRV